METDQVEGRTGLHIVRSVLTFEESKVAEIRSCQDRADVCKLAGIIMKATDDGRLYQVLQGQIGRTSGAWVHQAHWAMIGLAGYGAEIGEYVTDADGLWRREHVRVMMLGGGTYEHAEFRVIDGTHCDAWKRIR